MTNFNSELERRDYTLKIGDYFGRGWEIFKQYAWAFVAFVLVTAIITAVLSALPAPLGAGAGGDGAQFGGIVNAIISPILGAGFYIVAFNIIKNRPTSFGDFFKGFSNFLPIFLVSFIGNILVLIGFILLIFPGIYLAVSYFFSLCFVIEKRVDFWTALESSRRLVTRKWFSFFGFGLLILLLNLGGLLLCGVGLLVTVPWSICTVVAAYEDVVGLNLTDSTV